jgi:PAS domain S-box-containing protein
VLDGHGHVESWSAAAQRATGYSSEEIVGKHVAILYPAEEQASGEPSRDLARAEADGQVEGQFRRQRKDGKVFLAHVHTISLRSGGDGSARYVVLLRDVTDELRPCDVLPLSEERFRLMVDSIEDYAIFTLDPNGRITSWNTGAARLKGYTSAEIIGQSFQAFYTEEDRRNGRPQRLLREAAEHGRVEDEGWRVRKDGTRFWADVVISAMHAPGGELRGFAKVTRDLTERRIADERVRQSEERFRLLVEGVRDYAIYMLDPQGRVMTWNAGAERIKGYTAEEIIGQQVSRFYLDEEVRRGKCDRELEIASRAGRYEGEGWRLRKDGSRFWANVVISPLRDAGGHLVGYGTVTHDLTQRRKLEEERVRLAQAEESIRVRDEFLSVASHELKTPLTALQLQIQSVQRKVAPVDAALAARLDRAARSGQRLADLIQELLDVSRMTTGRFQIKRERFDMGDSVRELIERLRETAARAGCPLEVAAPPGIVGAWDRLRVEQVLTNLLANATKYGAGAPVHISVRREGSEVVLQVEDHGPGIPPQDLARIFGRFERASSVRHYGGLGLGLYVARQIVDAHDGSISAQNPSTGGALFTVRLPLYPRGSADTAVASGELH